MSLCVCLSLISCPRAQAFLLFPESLECRLSTGHSAWRCVALLASSDHVYTELKVDGGRCSISCPPRQQHAMIVKGRKEEGQDEKTKEKPSNLTISTEALVSSNIESSKEGKGTRKPPYPREFRPHLQFQCESEASLASVRFDRLVYRQSGHYFLLQ